MSREAGAGVDRPRVGVVGCGSIGSLLAAHLTEAGREVVAVDGWYPHVERMRSDGVVISTPDETTTVRVDARHPDEVGDLGAPFDLLLVAVKSYDTRAALALLAPYLGPGSVVVPVQNGMNESWFGDLLPSGRMVGCSVHVPAELTAPGRVTRYLPRSRRTFSYGPPAGAGTAEEQALAAWVAEVTAPAGGTEAVTDLVSVKWAKLAVNTMVNAPAGVTGWTTKQLWEDPRSAPWVARAAGETLAVAAAAGVADAPVFGRFEPRIFRDAAVDREAADSVTEALAVMAAERTGSSESRPSLLQDVERGRRTEIDYLNGYVVRAAAALGVPVPVNAALARLVREIDRGRLRPDPGNLDRLAAAVQP